MENFSIYKYMKLGIVHFKAYPECTNGEGQIIVETLRKIVEDDFWTAVEVGWMKDAKVRHEATKLLETSHLEVCYANQPGCSPSSSTSTTRIPRSARRR